MRDGVGLLLGRWHAVGKPPDFDGKPRVEVDPRDGLEPPTPDSEAFWWFLGLRPAPATPKTSYYLQSTPRSNVQR
jgi:hypothetical protein